MKPPSTTAELCQHPYRALFPLGWFMAWWGVLPWILFWLDSSFHYPRETHALILVQGVLTPFAVGFMFTMLPRRLDSAPPRAWQLVLSLVFPPLLVCLVWQQQLGLSHAAFAAQALMLFLFSASRIFGTAGARTGPAAFMWVPVAFIFGCIGSVLLSIAQFSPTLLSSSVTQFGWLILTQGLFLCLVLGIGTMFVPLTSHKQSSVDVALTDNPQRRRMGQLLAALGVALSFILEAQGFLLVARLLRASLVLITLIVAAGIHRPPTTPGTQRKLIWIASWCLPIGILLTAVIPDLPQIGLHVLFIGGLLLVTLSVALHVGLAHSSGQALVSKPVGAIRAFGVLLMLALLLRIIAELDMAHRYDWAAASAGVLLLSLLPWGWLILPRLLPALLPAPKDGDSLEV